MLTIIATSRGKTPDPNVESQVDVLRQGPDGNLSRVGALLHLAKGEDLRAIRYDDDRAYLGVLQGEFDALGKGITAANEQIERAGGRPETLSDAGWRQDTQAVAQQFSDAAAKIRAAAPGPATGEVHRFARNAADRADEAAAGLNAALESRDARALNGVRTTLVRMLAEINNMNLTLLQLQ